MCRKYNRAVLQAVSCAFHRIVVRLVGSTGTSPGKSQEHTLVDHGALCLALEAVCEASVS
jgi:hypothetical protein